MTIVGSKADYRREHFRFPHQMSDKIPLEPTRPVEGWASAIVAVICLAVFMAGALFLASAIGEEIAAQGWLR